MGNQTISVCMEKRTLDVILCGIFRIRRHSVIGDIFKVTIPEAKVLEIRLQSNDSREKSKVNGFYNQILTAIRSTLVETAHGRVPKRTSRISCSLRSKFIRDEKQAW